MQFLKSIMHKESFNPRFIGLFINPFYFARRGLYQGIKQLAPLIGGEILDVGCGVKPYKNLFQCKSYTGIDVEQSGHPHEKENIDLFYDGHHIPFDDSSFDAVVTFEVLEHVFHPEEFLSEIKRVLKTRGKLLLTVPFIWDEHEIPYDYGRYSSFGLKDLLNRQGFKIEIHKKTIASFGVIIQMINAYIYKIIMGKKPGKIKYILIILITGPINLLGSLVAFLLPKNQDL